MSDLRLSAIVASYNSRKTIVRCLESLEKQASGGIAEILVVDSSDDGTSELVSRQFPKVRLFTFSKRRYPGDARNIAVSHSKGDILAFVDTDCVVAPDWARQIIKAHQGRDSVIGGTIDNANPESYVGWGAYFCKFNHWMPNTPEGEVALLPTCVLSLSRRMFDRHGPLLEGTFSADTAFSWNLEEAGVKRLLIPSIRVSHMNIDRLGMFLKTQIERGRSFASLRVSEKHFSRLRRFCYVLGSPLLPFLLLYRTARTVLARGVYVKEFVRSAPLVFLGFCLWSWGELRGYSSRQ